MTHIFTSPRSAHYAAENSQKTRYVNIWSRPPYTTYSAGDKHYTRAVADMYVKKAEGAASGYKCLYRVVVRFK